ncbi:tRNA glutamyl-Q(34) synthetase GluQRS [Rhodobacterales bacterium FZCC0083]|nr:tRNA glutamyl-Q(34) synthetase GluQRS [Rhodobacterales bacterium FZCC0083]
MTFRTRFAPSPTGPLHLGHAYSALYGHRLAEAKNGLWLLRIDDLDHSRSKPEWTQQIFDDLRWLGLAWPEPVRFQSQKTASYQTALDALARAGVIYPCCCNRADIAQAAAAPQEGVPEFGPDGRIYPGTCRHRSLSQAGAGDALRLNMRKAVKALQKPVTYEEFGTQLSERITLKPEALIAQVGDVVLRRKDQGAAYHLAVVIDDDAQNITDVVRGADLSAATQIHVVLQQLLNIQTPRYHHHALIRDKTGKRLAKRSDSEALSTLRNAGHSAQDITERLFSAG